MPAETIVTSALASEVLCSQLCPSKLACSEMKEIPSPVSEVGEPWIFLLSLKILPGDSKEQHRHKYGCAFEMLSDSVEFSSGKECLPWHEEEIPNCVTGNTALCDRAKKKTNKPLCGFQ